MGEGEGGWAQWGLNASFVCQSVSQRERRKRRQRIDWKKMDASGDDQSVIQFHVLDVFVVFVVVVIVLWSRWSGREIQISHRAVGVPALAQNVDT